MTDPLAAPPTHAFLDGNYQYGRYHRPIADPNVIAPGIMGRFRLKEWHYSSFVTPDWFFAFAAVNLGYAAKVFAYVVDRQNPADRQEYTKLAPLAKGLRFAPSSISGTTEWKSGRSLLKATYHDGWNVQVDLPMRSGRIAGELKLKDGAALALLFPLPNGGPAYTHKAAGLPVQGKLTFGSRILDFSNSTGTLDWTRSVAMRETRWKWCSLAGVTRSGERIGLNLSAQVYDNPAGNSLENGLWINGQMYPLGGVHFEIPADPRRQTWIIRSQTDDSVELKFTPLGTREEQLNLGVIRSDFIQPYGQFNGSVCAPGNGNRPVDVTGLFGVVEKHLSVW